MSSFADVLTEIRTPSQVESFVYGIQPTITIVTEDKKEGDTLELENITPFHTLKELLREIWAQSKKGDELFPSRVFFAEKRENSFYPVFFDWIVDGQVIGFDDPVQIFQTSTLTDADGLSLNLEGSERSESREDVLLETKYPTLESGSIELYVFSYSALRDVFIKQTGRTTDTITAQWDTLFKYFFGKRSDAELRADIPASSKQQIQTAVTAKQETIRILENLIKTELTNDSTEVISVKQLKLYWKQPLAGFEGTDVLFFVAPVTRSRPYMRYVPVSGTPLTKLYQEDSLDTPYVDDPKLLKGWTNAGSPLVNEDILITKQVLREKAPFVPPLFATLYTLPDATAVFELQPPKGMKSFQYATDMPALADPDAFAEALLKDMPYEIFVPTLHTYTCVLRFDYSSVPTFDVRKVLPKRLEQLRTLFGVSTIADESIKPFLALRYRAVSNFKTKSNIFAYIQGVFETEFGPVDTTEEIQKVILTRLKEEFEVSDKLATELYNEFIENKSKFTLVSGEEQEFISKVNLGVTLLFKGYSPTIFDVHCYNISSLETLRRITTILNYAFYSTEDEWAAATGVEEAEVEEKDEEEGVEDETEADLEEEEEEKEEEEEEEEEAVSKFKTRQEAIDPRGWYLNRLYALDAVLFKPPNEAGKPKFSYVGKCQANYDKQPAVLTEKEFMRVWKAYTESDRLIKGIPCNEYVKLIVYGVPETTKMLGDAKGARETFVFLKFGSSSDSKKANYYTCSRLFCLLDVMPILEADFISEVGADGEKKSKSTCPFCRNGKITDRDARDYTPKPGETVLDRRPKPNKPQTAIGFLKDAGHPQGLDVPCCGVKEKHIMWEDPRFSKYKGSKPARRLKAATEATAVEVAEAKETEEREEEEFEEVEDLRYRAAGSTNFSMLRFSLNKQYIKGANIYPLDEGTIGCPQLNVDRMFGQKSTDMIARTVVRQEFRTEANGLFRLGVQNKPYALHNSFFAAIAPMLGLNTADDVSEFLALRIQPRIFLNLNFGNLVLEFYDPTDEANNGSDDEVNAWGRKYLLTSAILVTSELHRFFNSYKRFIDYIRGQGEFVGKTKQMRHFAHALAEPGLLFSDGLTLMVLQYIGDPRTATVEVKMKCPVLGLDITRYANNQIGILTYSDLRFWEPMIYVDQIQRKDVVTAAQEGYYTIDKELLLQDTFPDPIKQQYQAFTTQCRSAFRGAFTYQSGIDNRLLLPITRALSILSNIEAKPNGLVRDSYNHLVALTVPVAGTGKNVLVPIVDDGNSFHNNTALQIYIGVHSVPLANANDVYTIYSNQLEPELMKYNRLYELTGFQRTDEGVSRFQIGGIITIGTEEPQQSIQLPTITLPCEATRIDEDTLGGKPIEPIEGKDKELEYQIDRAIRFGFPDSGLKNGNNYKEYSKTILSPIVSDYLVTREQIENIYEHLRLTFSIWINEVDHKTLKNTLEERILENRRISDFERIKRLDILLRSTVTNWLQADDTLIEDSSIFFRRDCIKIPMDENNDQSKCSGYCTKGDDEQCKIHIPVSVPLDVKTVADATDYFCNRLFNELARLPAKRVELINKKVKKVQIPRTNVHIDKHQWILPETVPAWDKLLTQSEVLFTENPQYYEEFSRSITPEEEDAELEELSKAGIFDALPEVLKTYFTPQGQQEILVKLFNGIDPAKNILEYFGMYEYSTKRSRQVIFPQEYFIEKDFYELTKTLKIPIVQIQFTEGRIMAYKSRLAPLTTSTYIVIPDFPVEEGVRSAAVLITKDQLNPTIPLSFLNPETLPLSSFKTSIPALKKPVAQLGGAESDGEMMF
jgi:hypothetical protein